MAKTEWVLEGTPCKTFQEVIERISGQSAEDLMFPDLVPPESIKNMPDAATVINNAIANDDNIAVFGDYDADGVCAMAILFLLLTELRAKKHSAKPITVRAPKRISEGYGLSEAAVDEVNDGLLIVVDNGISAIDAIDKAKHKGLSVVVLDHHLPGVDLPNADVIVDPFVDWAETDTGFCGAGLAFKLAELMLQEEKDKGLLYKLNALAAIATVADSVPLKDGNRAIVKQGLAAMNSKQMTQGLASIIAACSLTKIDEETIAFKIAPVLNAAGRLYDDGARYVSACLAQNIHPMDSLAQKLVNINETRKQLVKEACEIAYSQIDPSEAKPAICVVPSKYEGIVGIVAGKISEQYQVPAYVFSSNDGTLKGSGRADTDEFNLFEFTQQVADLLDRYGGHAGAVGLVLQEERLPEFKRRVGEEYALTEPTNRNCVKYDMEISAFSVCDFIKEQEKYAPYGVGARKPVFMIRNVSLLETQGGFVQYMGKGRQHLKFRTRDYSLVGFDMAEKYSQEGNPQKIDVVGTIGINESPFGTQAQVLIIDFKKSEEQ